MEMKSFEPARDFVSMSFKKKFSVKQYCLREVWRWVV